MKRTRPITLIIFAGVGVIVGYLGNVLLIAAGMRAIVPPLTLSITLFGMAALLVWIAWPIRQAVKARRGSEPTTNPRNLNSQKKVDPFFASRVVVLAKACIVVGALVLGLSLGVLLFLLSRTVIAPAATLWLAISAAGSAVALIVGGLIAEFFCTLPPDGTSNDPEEGGQVRA